MPLGPLGIKQASSEAATGPGILEQNTERRKGAYALGGHGGLKDSGRFLHRDRPLANIYVNNQKGSFRNCILKIHT